MIGSIPRMSPKTVGTLQVHALVDSVGPTRPPEELLLDLDPDVISRNAEWLAPDYIDPQTGLLIMAYTSFLVQTNGHTILVDCAIGEDGTFPARPDWHKAKSDWLNHLGLAGKAPADIETVFLTHLHVDHTGWLTRKVDDRWVPSFPQAEHFASETELAFWPAHHEEYAFMADSISESVEPVIASGLLKPIETELELAPGLFVADLSGHSPGMIGLEYRKNGRILAAFAADLMHHPLQMAAPDASTKFCSDPDGAALRRREKLEWYAQDKTLIFCDHFPGECAGHAVKQHDGFRFVPAAA